MSIKRFKNVRRKNKMIYKRKFLVPGNTPKGKNYNERSRMCDEFCGEVYGNRTTMNPSRSSLPCGSPWRPDYSKCVKKEKMFRTYLVSEKEDGTWECACKAWTMKFPRRDCKHIRKAQANPTEYEIAKEFTQRRVNTLRKFLE